MTKQQFLTTFFSRLNQDCIDYFVYGEYRQLPVNTGGSDIDMIVSKNDFTKVVTLLCALAKENKVIIASKYANANAYFYRCLSDNWGVQIDILEDGLYFQGVPYYPIEKLRKHVIEHNKIKVVKYDYGFFADYFKEILHKGKAKEKYRTAVIKAMIQQDEECSMDIKELYGQDTLEMIKSNLTFEGLNEIGLSLQKNIRKKILKGKTMTVLKTKVLLSKRLFTKKPGYVIAVLGTDGSGKSTIINAITPWLNEGFHHGVIYNHLRPNILPDLGVTLGKKSAVSKKEASTVCSDPHGQKPSGFVGSMMRWGYYMLDYTVGYMLSVWKTIHIHSKVFIFDRYYYDYYIDQRRSRTSLPHWILRLGECIVPTPDIILCLGGDPQKIYNRKPETSLEEVTRQTCALQKFCHNHHKAVWIDTTTSLQESINATQSAILTMLAKRFK